MQYRAGTVSLTNGSALVAGTGTEWLGAVEEGAMFVRSGDRASYTVAAVAADDALTLTAPYQGASTTAANYWITTSFTPNRGYPVPEQGDVDAVLVVSRAIQEIDADIPETGGGVRVLDDLQDVSAAGASAGQVLTRMADGWAPASAGELAVNAVNLGTGGATLFRQKTGITLEFRRIKVAGGATLAENPDDVTITVPAAGEANTASNAGSAGSVGVFARKVAANLEFRGLRAGAGVTVTQDANDVVVSATGGGTSGGGEANTAANVGVGTLQMFRQKVGAELQFRTVALDQDRFTTAMSADGNTYTITFRPLSLADVEGIDVTGVQAGHYLRYNDDGTWGSAAPPPAGMTSVSADAAPTLGGDLGTNGHRILGLPGVIPGMVEAPQTKDYVLALRLPAPIVVTSAGMRTGTGTTGFSVRVNGTVVGADLEGAGGLAGTATTDYAETQVVNQLTTAAGSELVLRLSGPSADCADLSFSVFYRTA